MWYWITIRYRQQCVKVILMVGNYTTLHKLDLEYQHYVLSLEKSYSKRVY